MLLKGFGFTHVEMLPKGCVLKLSITTRREVIIALSERYRRAETRVDKSSIIDEAVALLSCHRKHAIRALANPPSATPTKSRRNYPIAYKEALVAIQRSWEALDYPCAERLHPVLLETAQTLACHGHLTLDETIKYQLESISRATLARRLAILRSPKPKPMISKRKPLAALRAEVLMVTYAWNEDKPGALEVDLVEHNGGASVGTFCYTLTVVDIVTGYTRRRALLGKSQLTVLCELKRVISEWPMKPWCIHSDNGQEFLNSHLRRFCSAAQIKFTRSRPYRKNDNAHVEQKNGFLVRQVVGYERYDTLEQVEWLNTIYALHDPYSNFCLPMRKLVHKERSGARVKKTFDAARSPVVRLIESGILADMEVKQLKITRSSVDPLSLHRELESLLAQPVLPVYTNLQEEAI